MDLNRAGQAAGSYLVNSVQSAFYYDGARLIDFGGMLTTEFGARGSFATGLNDQGQVVAAMWAETGYSVRGFLFNGSSGVALHRLTVQRRKRR